MTKNSNDIQQYSHNTTKKILDTKTKKCTLCDRPDSLLLLPKEFQEHAAKKNYISYYCVHCLQAVNFCI